MECFYMTKTDMFKSDWMRHAWQPALSQLPVVLWAIALVFDVLTQFKIGGNLLVQLSFFFIAVGLIITFFTLPANLVSWAEFKKEQRAWKLGLGQATLGLVVAVVYAVNLGVRVSTFASAEMVGGVALTLSAIGAVLLIASAYLSGLLTFNHSDTEMPAKQG